MDVNVKNSNGKVEFGLKDMLKGSKKFADDSLIRELKCLFKFVNLFDNKTYFFKGNSPITSQLGEVVGYIIANALGVKNVKPIPAVYFEGNKKIEGILSLDFIENRQTDVILNGDDLYDYFNVDFQKHSVDVYMDLLKKYANQFVENKVFVDPNMRFELLKLATFFLFSSQEDAYPRNINFIIKQISPGVGKIELAPQCDNSFCCFIKSFTGKKIPNENFKESYNLIENNLLYTHVSFQVKPSENLHSFYSRTKLVSDLAKEAIINPQFKKYLKSLENINLYEEFKKYNRENPAYKIPKKIKQAAYCIFEISKNSISEQLEKYQNKIATDQLEMIK